MRVPGREGVCFLGVFDFGFLLVYSGVESFYGI